MEDFIIFALEDSKTYPIQRSNILYHVGLLLNRRNTFKELSILSIFQET